MTYSLFAINGRIVDLWFGDNDHGHTSLIEFGGSQSFYSIDDVLASLKEVGLPEVFFIARDDQGWAFPDGDEGMEDFALAICDLNFTIWTSFMCAMSTGKHTYTSFLGFAFSDAISAMQFRLVAPSDMHLLDLERIRSWENFIHRGATTQRRAVTKAAFGKVLSNSA